MKKKTSSDKPTLIAPLSDFFKQESASGIVIILAATLGIIWANSTFSASYFSILETYFKFEFSTFSFEMDIAHFINDGLMTIFFFLVGLEIKREITVGHLSSRKKFIVPLFAALGGMAIPALIYLAIAGSIEPRGWAIPIATDIALALGVLGLVQAKTAPSLRPFLLGLAVIDDIGAILIIAIFFSTGLNFSWLLAALLAVLLTLISKYFNIRFTTVYVIIGIFLWYCFYKSGVHPTIAGVILGLIAPITPFNSSNFIDTEELANISTVKHALKSKKIAKNSVSIVEWLEHAIHPWSAFVIVPIFAWANAGIEITSKTFGIVFGSKVAWAIMLGLVVGKPLGVLIFSLIAKSSGLGQLPENTSWAQLWATGKSAGIGFTVAIFIAKLAFKDLEMQSLAIISVLIASVVSGLLSIAIFSFTKPSRSSKPIKV